MLSPSSGASRRRSASRSTFRSPMNGFLGSTLSSSHQARYSSVERSNSRRIPFISVASNVAIGYEPLFTTRPWNVPTESSNSTAAKYP